MNEWKEYKLGELYNFSSGLSKGREYFGSGFGFLSFKDVFYNYFLPDNLTELVQTNEKEQISCSIKCGDVFLTRTSETMEELGQSSVALKDYPKATFNGFTKRLRPKSSLVHPEFAGYYFRSPKFRATVSRYAIMTTRASLNNEILGRLTINLPTIEIQKEIGEILKSLDDKIELNNKINQELENLAQTLFKQWFIDFEFPNENGKPYKSSGGALVDSELGEIPKGWEVKKLGELVKKSNTGADAIKRAPIVTEDTGIRCVRVGDMTNKRPFDEWGFCKITPEDYKRYKLEINDIVVTRTATLGINTIIRNEIKGVYNNGLIRLKIDSSKILPLLAYCFFQSDSYKIWIERISGDSSTRPNMQINYLLDFPMYQSPLNIQNRFIEQAEIIFESLESNILENKELTNLRDTLLPKLISGELEVNGLNLDSLDLLDEKDFKKKADNNQGNQDNLNNQGSDK